MDNGLWVKDDNGFFGRQANAAVELAARASSTAAAAEAMTIKFLYLNVILLKQKTVLYGRAANAAVELAARASSTAAAVEATTIGFLY